LAVASGRIANFELIKERAVIFSSKNSKKNPSNGRGTRHRVARVLVAAASWAIAPAALAQQGPTPDVKCDAGNGGITLSPGFCATIFADKIGHARHMTVGANGVVYVNTWSGRYYGYDRPPPGGFLVALQDTTGSGHADKVVRFGGTVQSGSAGGTGIALYKNALYAEVNDRIERYALRDGDVAPSGPPEVIVSGLPLTGDHPMHPFKIDAQGHLYVDLGSATNSCQRQNRMPNSPGINPCTELETRAGTWLYDANKTGQRFSPAERFVTGLRNGEGFAFDSAGTLFATQHGRDQLRENWPKFYTPEQGANEPAEELVQLERGADYGWPYCYFDLTLNKLVLAPEYGGDGKKVGLCADKRGPLAVFPGHWAPNDLMIYQGEQFPAPLRGGAFLAFHGSWNRAPFPQGGYNVVFQPLADGKPSGQYVVFADGFAGAIKEPGGAAHRPSGLAMGPDGALYISDDQRGRIWRVVYVGGTEVAGIQAAPAPSTATSAGPSGPPEGIHPEAGREANLPAPPGIAPDQVALGNRIYRGEAAGGTCAGCHGSNGEGSPLAPSLVTSSWLWGNGSLQSIEQIIENGVPQPKKYRDPMPPMGGAQLSPSQVTAVAAYVWALNHRKGDERARLDRRRKQ
jgi:glucose/arabinose dehydrogenase/mono/diheme cytochrome c family protein